MRLRICSSVTNSPYSSGLIQPPKICTANISRPLMNVVITSQLPCR